MRVKRQRALGFNRDEIIERARAGADNYPRPGVALSKGTLSPIEAAIARGEPPTGKRAARVRRREMTTRMERAAEQLTVRSKASHDLAQLGKRLADVGVRLAQLDIAELDDLEDPFIGRLMDSTFEHLVDVMELMEVRVVLFQSRASDQSTRRVIAMLHAKAESTTFPHEAEVARTLIRKLESKRELERGA